MSVPGIQFQKMKFAIAVRPQADETGASPTSYVFDTDGVKAVSLLIICGTCGTPPTTMKVQESDAKSSATALTNATDVSGADFSVSPLTLAGSTGTGILSAVTIPLGTRKRYLQLSLTAAAAATFIAAVWVAESCDEAPASAASRGLGQHAITVGSV